MVAFSKPTLLDITCYELGHTWTPSCTQASKDVALSVFKESVKIYGSLFFIAGLIRRRGKSYFKKKVWQETLQSSIFLTMNGSLFLAFFCLFRRLAGFYFYLSGILCGIPACAMSIVIERKERKLMGSFYYVNSIAFVPMLAASVVAILLERKSRRGLLAVYMSQVKIQGIAIGFVVVQGAIYCIKAAELFWRMMEARGYVRSIPNGEVFIFSVASAIYLYYFKQNNGLPDGIMSIFKKLFGQHETIPAADSSELTLVKEQDTENHEQTSETNNAKTSNHVILQYHKVVRWLKSCPKHRLCKHTHSCCFYVIQGTIKLFGVGYAVQAGIKLIGSLGKLLKQPKSVIKQSLFSSNNVKLGAFLGSFVGIFKAINCLLRWCRDKDEKLHGMVAGFLAGWSMLFYKSQTVALYSAAKLAEVLYFKGIALGLVPYIKCADVIVYSVSTALVFHAAVLEPHNLRPAYWKFLLRVTGNKFAIMNRRLVDPWVPNCSKINPNYWPDYDPKYSKLVNPDTLKS